MYARAASRGGMTCLGRVPHVGEQARVEVAERARHHGGLDVAEHAAAAEEVEPEAVEPELLAVAMVSGCEVERGTDVARLGWRWR